MPGDMRSWIERVLAEPRRLALPIMTYPGLQLTGQTVLEAVSDSDAQFACMKALGESYPVIAAQTLMDLSVEAEALGCRVKFSRDESPVVIEPVIKEEDDLDRFTLPETGAKRMSAFLGAVERAARHFTDRPVLGGMIGPLSLAVRLRDMSQVMMDLLLQPEFIHRLLEFCVEFQIRYARAYRERGANGVLIAEPAAGLLSLEHCEEFSSQYVRRIVEAVQTDHFSVILHNCGRTTHLAASMAATGAHGLHFGNAVNMTDILPQVPATILVFGNLDPAGLFRNGSPEQVGEATARLLEATADFPNFVISSGCDIPPGSPLRNLDAFFAALDKYNQGVM